MGLYNSDGTVYTPEEYPVRTPAEVGAGAGAFLKRAAAPIAAQTGGELAGSAIGAALAPETGGLSVALPLIMGAMGAGGANVVASKKLPPKYGGDPNASKTSDFLWGALPSIAGRGIPKAIGGALAKRAAAGAAEDAAAFEKGAQAGAKETHGALVEGVQGPPPTAEGVRNIGRTLGSPTGQGAQPLTGEARTQATDAATNLVLGPINRMRQKLGEPIGAAYRALKGNTTPIDDKAAADIAEAAQNVSDNMISPSPQARPIFAKIRSFVPQGAPAGQEPLSVLQQRTLGTNAPVKVSNEDLARLTAEPGELPKETAGQPPTLDELREARQVVNERLRSAKGGDAHALLNLQQVIDKHLMEHLPEDIGEKRAAYRGFIKNYDWRDINKLRRAGTPDQVGDWLFNQDKSVTNEVINNANPAEKDAYQQLFAQHILSNVDPNLPPKAQSDAIRKSLQPYIQNGSTRALYGDALSKQVADQIYMPLRRAEVADALKSPAGQRAYGDAFMAKAKASGKSAREAAEAGYQAFYDSLPPAQQQTLRASASPIGQAEPVILPSAQESLSTALKPNGKGMYIPRFAIASALGSAATLGAGAAGGSSYMLRAGIGFGLLAAGSTGYRALMDAGGADLVAKMYSSAGTRAAGAAGFNALVKLGSRKLKEQPDSAQQ